jgi:hypothetical protein
MAVNNTYQIIENLATAGLKMQEIKEYYEKWHQSEKGLDTRAYCYGEIKEIQKVMDSIRVILKRTVGGS